MHPQTIKYTKKNSRILNTVVAIFFGAFVVMQTAMASFQDVPPQDDNYIAIDYLQENGIVAGYDNGTRFSPDELLTRAQALKILIESSPLKDKVDAARASIDAGATVPLQDVASTDWFAPYVLVAMDAGAIQGTSEGNFEGARTVTTAEFAKMMLEFNHFDLTPWTGKQIFTDVPVNVWFNPYMNYIGQTRIVQPSADNKVYPLQSVRRRDVAQMMYVMALILRDKDIPFLLGQAEQQMNQVEIYMNDKNVTAAQHASRLAVDITQQLYKYYPDDSSVLSRAKLARAYDFFMNSVAASQLKSNAMTLDWTDQALMKAGEALQVDPQTKPMVEKLQQLIDQQRAL